MRSSSSKPSSEGFHVQVWEVLKRSDGDPSMFFANEARKIGDFTRLGSGSWVYFGPQLRNAKYTSFTATEASPWKMSVS
jgi:hypothetical protein